MLPAYEDTRPPALTLVTRTIAAPQGRYFYRPFHSSSVHAEGSGNSTDALALLTQMLDLLQKVFPVHSASYLAVNAEHYTRVRAMQPGQIA
jgi:hypothetical protein